MKNNACPPPMQLHMLWPVRSDAQPPNAAVPSGYEVRPLRDDDADGYLSVMQQAGFKHADAAFLESWRQIALPNGVFVAIHQADGAVAATALSSHRPTALHPHGAELGWVAGSAEHAGRGLGRAVCIAALRRAISAGYDHIYLSTDDWRLAAINVYLSLGMVPYLYMDDMAGRWKHVCNQLGRPADERTWITADEKLWIRAEPDERPNADDVNRYRRRHRWLPDRQHSGFSGIGDMDAFGDESLYHPSQIGTAVVQPSQVTVGATAPLRLTFTVGADGLPLGAKVTFVIRGQYPLGKDCPTAEVSGPDHAELDAGPFCFTLTQGTLTEGDVVDLRFPPFKWTPLSGRREFKVVITFPETVPERRLPEPLTVDVLPDSAQRLELTLPCTHTGELSIPVRITARDRFDNRVAISAPIRLQCGDVVKAASLHQGLTDACVPPSPGGRITVTATMPDMTLACHSNISIATHDAQYYIGDLHCHDFLSEAEGYPDALYRWAIEDRRLDFVSVVPQSHGWHDNETWTVVKYMNERYLHEGAFVTLLGFEWQHSAYGDKVVHYLGGDQPYLPVDDRRYCSASRLYKALRASDALVISHHPAYPKGSWCSSTDFEAVETDVERLVELWSMHGSSEGYDPADRPMPKSQPESMVMAALQRGLRLGFTAGSDTHSGRPGGSIKEPLPYWGGLTGVWAEDLTRRSLFNALHQRRTVALTGERIILRMTVNDTPMGSEIAAADQAEIRIEAWSPAPIAHVEVIKNTACLKTFNINDDTANLTLSDITGGPAFYHCRVTLMNGHLAVCSPVWVG